jgi:hypothetical protein
MDLQELVCVVAAAANVEPHLAQEVLAEENNDANAAVPLLLKRQEEAKAVAVLESKAGQGAALQGKARHCWSCGSCRQASHCRAAPMSMCIVRTQ